MPKSKPQDQPVPYATGVQFAIPEDMAGYGDTRHVLHYKALPHRRGPDYKSPGISQAPPEPVEPYLWTNDNYTSKKFGDFEEDLG